MSRGSKARRDAKRRADRRVSDRPTGRSSAHDLGFEASVTWHDPGDIERNLNRMFRKSCSDCDGPITWTDEEGARNQGMDVDQALAFMGAAAGTPLEWWVCETCGNAGLMGPPAFGI